MFQPRQYQREAIDSIYKAWESKSGKNVIVVAPTGSGKSLMLAILISEVVKQGARVLVLTHRAELIKQDAKAIEIETGIRPGIYSAGLNRKDRHEAVTVAGIQSIGKQAFLLDPFDIVIVDECFPPDVEILTEKGFIPFGEYKSEKVAQFDNGIISFVTPEDVINKQYSGEMIRIHSQKLVDLSMTAGHELLISYKTKDKKESVSDVHFNTFKRMYVAGNAYGVDRCLTPDERLAIAFQADGNIHRIYTGKNSDKTKGIGAFSFSKTRKIDEFMKIMKDGNYRWRLNDITKAHENFNDKYRYMVYDMPISKDLPSLFNLSSLSVNTARLIIEEMVKWDGSVCSKNRYYFSSRHKKIVDFYQAVAVLAGYKTMVRVQVDNRSEKFSDIYRLFIMKNVHKIGCQQIKKERYHYDGTVHCVRVPSGNIIVRSNGFTLVVGNCHLIPRKSTTLYKRFLDESLIANPKIKIVGFSATPYRLDSGYLHEGKDAIFDTISYEIGIMELIKDGFLCPVISKSGIQSIDLTGVHIRGGEYVQEELAHAAENSEMVKAAVKEIVSLGKDRKAWMVFASSVKHAEMLRDEIAKYSIPVEIIIGSTQHRDKIIDDYKSGKVRCLVSVSVLTTGFDAPHTDLLAILRPTKSTALYVQLCLDEKTEILTKEGWKGIGEIDKGMIVASFDMNTSKGYWVPALSIVDRERHEDEKMVSISTNRLDIRVTGGHDMVVSSQKFDGTFSNWKKETAENISLKKDGYRIPSAFNMDHKGLPLQDYDLRFIGMFMTDGCLNKKTNGITFFQSERYPEIIEFIRKFLNEGNFKYTEVSRVGDICFGKPRTNPIHLFTVSFGTPRGTDKDRRGWSHLKDYISKDFPEILMECSSDQFRILLEAIHLGDGAKSANVTWTRRSYSISTGNKLYAERLQIASLIHGMSASISTYIKDRRNPLYIINITPSSTRTVGGSNQKDRKCLEIEKFSKNERVWCIETEHGTIVTRRNGKVAILGNCGRGMRIYPGKTNCLVLDYAGVVKEHGPVDTAYQKRKGSNGGEAPVKICPKCKTILHISILECPECGYLFPEREISAHDGKAYAGAILSDQIKPEIAEVSDVRYVVHHKVGKPDSVRIEYQCGMFITHREWLCPEHEGTARRKFITRWLTEYRLKNPPKTVAEFMVRLNEIPKPLEIVVRAIPGNKFVEILERKYIQSNAIDKIEELV